jgi:8-oxo-dGTP pyrophosphatase MutT (NUDIX family)
MPYHAMMPLWDDKDDAQKLDALRAMILDLYAYTLGDVRARLLQILSNAQSADEKEAHDITTMQKLIQAHSNIMAQNCEIGHITGSALIIDGTQARTGGRVLLHHHRTLKRWLQMGGHADYEKDFAQVALREASEESGLDDLAFLPKPDPQNDILPIDFDIHTIPASKGRPEHLHLDWRYVLVTHQPDDVAPPKDESQKWQWLSFDEALKSDDVEPALKRLIGKARNAWQTQR